MEGKRFSDEKIQKFYEEFVRHKTEEERLYKELTTAVQENSEKLERVHDAVVLWDDIRGTVRVLAGFGRVVKWVAGTGAAIGAIWYAITHGVHPK